MTGWIQLNQWLARAALLGLAALLAHQSWGLYGSLASPSTTSAGISGHSVVANSPNEEASVPLKRQGIGPLVTASLFGKTTTITTVRKIQQPKPQLTQTRLNLKLIGVVRADSGTAVAIIASGRQQRAYVSGDLLSMSEPVKVVEILNDRVVLNRQGALEYLQLQEPVTQVGIVTHQPVVSVVALNSPQQKRASRIQRGAKLSRKQREHQRRQEERR